MPATPQLGLRERKRIATSKALQLAALRLVVERGIDNVTVEQIATAADVSPRTFFNYFPSKEAAIVGEGPTLPVGEEQQLFVSGGEHRVILHDLGELIALAAEHVSIDAEALKLRQEVHRQNPQLASLLMLGRRHFEDEIVALVSRRLIADNSEWKQDDAARESRARLIALVATATMRHAWLRWADGDGDLALAEQMRLSFAEFESLVSPQLVG